MSRHGFRQLWRFSHFVTKTKDIQIILGIGASHTLDLEPIFNGQSIQQINIPQNGSQ